MAINPIVYAEKVVSSFLKYQLTAYPFADPRLFDQMRTLLSLQQVRRTPLLRGPYISLSRGFRQGASVEELTTQGLLHPHMRQLIPAAISHVYGHQEKAIRSIVSGKTTLVSTGTGSGKTECFLYPIISRCLQLKDLGAAAGVCAVILYPMNSLAEDQLERLRGILAGSGITFGMYVGKTPEHDRDVKGFRMPSGSTRADYLSKLKDFRDEGRSDSVIPCEEVGSREKMRESGCQPRILLTNVKQLELLLTRQLDIELFANSRLDFLAFDEAHTFTGINGAETACLIRRLRVFCGLSAAQTTCIATSATIVDEKDPLAAQKFASRFFGTPAESVVTINEEYQQEDWRNVSFAPAAPEDPRRVLELTLKAVESTAADREIAECYRLLTGKRLSGGDWKEALFNGLQTNDLAARIRNELHGPRELPVLLNSLTVGVGRPVSEEELLAYLTLGAASLKDGRPLYRPVVHAFIRGISGAVVTFPGGSDPKLWLSSEEELTRGHDADRAWRPKVHTCTTCGQHYFITFLKDFAFTGAQLEGGQSAEAGGHYWEALDEARGGNRVVLLDRLVSAEDGDLDPSPRTQPLHFCRHCGSAHPTSFSRCLGCSSVSAPVSLQVIRSKGENPGYLTSCLSCGARGKSMGRRYREPCREVRAVNVSDVHVLSQDMVQHADRKRLLLFADNRQDASFQAGWMKDHARRFRLRRFMADTIESGAKTVGDMAREVSDLLGEDEGLSRALIPEVWRAEPKEGASTRHDEERLHFLRIQVLREVTMAGNQQIGLEPWGRMKVDYHGLNASAGFVQNWSRRLGLPAEELTSGIATLLDSLRRRQLLKDSRIDIFSKWWQDGDREIQRGYMPAPSQGPKGMKLRLEGADDKGRIMQWLSDRTTLIRQVVTKWGVPVNDAPDFITQLWTWLTSADVGLIISVTLKSSRGNSLPNCSGTYQIDSGRLILSRNHGFYRCRACRRKVTRRGPRNLCIAWQCDGELEFVQEDPDNYNLQLLDERYEMLRPEEHTAMVPQDHRSRIENWFKGNGNSVNTLVCTPTLELGVDIGALDSVLLRNVPPLPANYWQRAGRAGRRHRMAVNLTYCRPASHDRSYFNDPLRMLLGRVDPPAFNLSNDLMISKHVFATVVTRLFQLAGAGSALAVADRDEIRTVLKEMLPNQVKIYLFLPDGQVREDSFDVTPLAQLIGKHRADLLLQVIRVFQQGWPAEDAGATQSGALEKHIDAIAGNLREVLQRLRRRLRWALSEMRRLDEIRRVQGTLESEDDVHYRRCDQLVKKLKGNWKKKRSEMDGVDDINTYSVLAREGLLPGYGLETGSVAGMAHIPHWHLGSMDFDLPRPSSMALREYVPGNLIYANGHKFVARRFHRQADAEHVDTPQFEVNMEREALVPIPAGAASASLGSTTLVALPICDVDLVHQSQISDEEENRFQLQVAVLGYELGRHNGGMAYRWSDLPIFIRRGVHLRLVNVGASALLSEVPPQLGYPVCTVCGQSVSPLSSAAQKSQFSTSHHDRCGKAPASIGFYTDFVADCITVPEMQNMEQAYSVLESLRIAAASVLDMHIDDLQILVTGYVDRDTVAAHLWDPMPGGSGLLDQLRLRFKDIIAVAAELLEGCPGQCAGSCNQCLQTFRNAFYHRYLNRHESLQQIGLWGNELLETHPIVGMQPQGQLADSEHQPVNDAETKLKRLLDAAGFTSGTFQEQIRFREKITPNHQIGSTTPDVYFRADLDDADDRGICIYLDGMSASIHGDPVTAARDREIRNWLRYDGYQVIEITRVELDDRDAMVRHFRKLARSLEGRALATQIADDPTWFDRGATR